MTQQTGLLLALLLCACTAPSNEPAPRAEPEGRAETQGIRNTEHIGVSGGAVADRVDQALEASERHAEDMRRAEEAANP